MKAFYAILAIILIASAVLMKDSDHGSKQAFADSIRVAGNFEK